MSYLLSIMYYDYFNHINILHVSKKIPVQSLLQCIFITIVMTAISVIVKVFHFLLLCLLFWFFYFFGDMGFVFFLSFLVVLLEFRTIPFEMPIFIHS